MRRIDYLFLLPALVVLVALVALPLGQVFSQSFTNTKLLAATKQFVGIANYIKLVQDKRFWNSVSVTFLLASISLVLQIAVGLDREIKSTMAGEEFEHVVEKSNTRGDRRLTGAIEIDLQRDFGLVGLAVDSGGSWHGVVLFDSYGREWLYLTMRSTMARQASFCSSVPTEMRKPSPQPS